MNKTKPLSLLTLALFAALAAPSALAEEEAAQPSPAKPPVRASLIGAGGAETLPPIVLPERPEGAGLPFAFEVGAQVFGEYALTLTESSSGGNDWFHAFDLPRAWLFTGMRVGDATVRVLLETTRTSGEGALIGVGGDSLVTRVREAWAGYDVLGWVDLRLGLVPQLTTPAVSELWGLRSVAEIGARSFELMQPADLGGTAKLRLPREFGSVGVGFYNGEGYRSREMNRGKSIEAMALLRPLATLEGLSPLALVVAYQRGSAGVGNARNDRVVGGLAWSDARYGVGVDFTYVMGIEDRGDRTARLVEGWARAEPSKRVPLILALRVGHLTRDLQLPGAENSATQITAALGARVAEPLRVFLAYDARLADRGFATASPGYERNVLRLVVEGNVGGRFAGFF